jgi:molybdopterin-guanine dinucleotide biosynthesis protein A
MVPARTEVAGAVLCGGRSSRMGRPKALLPWRGRTLIEHQVAFLAELFVEVVVVTSAELELPELRAHVVVDRAPGLGPLGGIREVLHAVEAERALVTSTDMPFVDREIVEELLEVGGTAACEVAGHLEPFPAVYERELAPIADALIAEGRMRPLHLLEAEGFVQLDGRAAVARGVFDGFNTPSEYDAALDRDARR